MSAALEVFWTRGYDGAYIEDLCAAMGVNKPSLYATFGNKADLFRKALELYCSDRMAYMNSALEAPTARQVAEQFLRGAIDVSGTPNGPTGCLLVISVLGGSGEAQTLRGEVLARRASLQQVMIARLTRAKAEKDLPASADPAGLTYYLYALAEGLSIQARAGERHDTLETLLATTMAAWPSP